MSDTAYSGTPLWKKLGYKPGFRAALIDVPENYSALIAGHPDPVDFTAPVGEADLIHWFGTELTVLKTFAETARRTMPADSMLWISWPKKATKVPTDITEDRIRQVILPTGLVDVKVCAVDAVWSGLKLVIRKELR